MISAVRAKDLKQAAPVDAAELARIRQTPFEKLTPADKDLLLREIAQRLGLLGPSDDKAL